MPFQLDFHSGIPIYIQLKNAIKMATVTGLYPPGSRLPTVRQLAVELKINPNTVSRVYSELEQEGILSTRQGRGSFVKDRPEAAEAGTTNRLEQLLDNLLAEAGQLGFTPAQVLKALENKLEHFQKP